MIHQTADGSQKIRRAGIHSPSASMSLGFPSPCRNFTGWLPFVGPLLVCTNHCMQETPYKPCRFGHNPDPVIKPSQFGLLVKVA